jgi:hypothetical protein
MTQVPFDGTPLTTTKARAGPGTRMAGFGGSWATCRVAEPSEAAVKVEFLSGIDNRSATVGGEQEEESSAHS